MDGLGQNCYMTTSDASKSKAGHGDKKLQHCLNTKPKLCFAKLSILFK